MFDKLGRHIGVAGIVRRQLNGNLEHILTEHSNPGRGVRLLQIAAAGHGRAAVEHTYVVQSQEASLENILAKAVLAVHPPGEVQHQLVKTSLEEIQVAFSVQHQFLPV
jgi:hypothetical protein